MKRTLLFTAALGTAVFALGANAQQPGGQMQGGQAQAQQRMSIAEIATMLEGQGYTVREIELERGRYEVEMIDANGMRVEAYLSAVTGDVLPYRDDDDRKGYRDDDHADYRGADRDDRYRYYRDDD
jgi:hypothetical protein